MSKLEFEIEPPSGPERSGLRAHAAACSCPHHRSRGDSPGGSWWASVAPIIACAICPACLTTYAKMLSALGIGFSLTEAQHLVLLTVAVGISLLVGSWRVRRTRRVAPFALTAAGCGLVLLSHALGDDHLLAWSGVAALLGGGVWEHWVWRQFAARSLGATDHRPQAGAQQALRS